MLFWKVSFAACIVLVAMVLFFVLLRVFLRNTMRIGSGSGLSLSGSLALDRRNRVVVVTYLGLQYVLLLSNGGCVLLDRLSTDQSQKCN